MKYCGLFVLIMMLGGCDAPRDDLVYEEEAYVFGTLVKFTVAGVPEDTAKKAVKEATEEFQKMHNEWNAWKQGELISINSSIAKGEPVEVSDFVLPVLELSKEFYEISDGLFNPAIGALIEAWGFHNDELPTGSLPSFDRIKTLVSQNPNMNDVSISGNTLVSTNSLVQFDLGGFGKGVALDRAEEILTKHGIKDAIINAGGDLNTMGNPAGRPWKVGIRHPIHWGAIAFVELHDGEDLYTSGNYEHFRESDGIKYAHIIDPRVGMPVEHIVSTSVIHNNGALADAAATAITIAGPENWEKIARKMGVHYVMLIDDQGVVYMNPAMKARVVFKENSDLKVIVSAAFTITNKQDL